jgi:hypothetical protein
MALQGTAGAGAGSGVSDGALVIMIGDPHRRAAGAAQCALGQGGDGLKSHWQTTFAVLFIIYISCKMHFYQLNFSNVALP